MKEFNSWFTISFNYCGKDIEHTISLNQLDIDEDTWFYYFKVNIKGEEYTMEVWGTYDDNKNVRTSGECLVDGHKVSACFGINVSDVTGDIIDYIDDIDIIDCD